MDSDTMRDYILNFSLDKCKLGSQGYNRVLLQLFGFTGHGKSSLINSCKYVVENGPYREYATVAGSDERPETMTRSSYPLTSTITLVDNRGCVRMNKDETGEIYAQLGNFLPLDKDVTWQSGFEGTLRRLLLSELEDRSADLLVPIFVYSAQTRISSTQFYELKEFLDKARKITGLDPVVVITHELSGNFEEVMKKFREMGVKNRFPLENYTKEDHLKTRGKHESILKCLFEVIKDVEFRMGLKRDPNREKMERKEIIITFLHEREKEKAEQEAQQRAQEREREEAYRRQQQAQRDDSSCVIQ
ncbi:uncharacterized protein [Hyperolius riggenbachi]|uniref:uncharacterized protein n=1 Tax=Hyperolius riggenbachi TaxID=752182 RepID=UPI0035A314A4